MCIFMPNCMLLTYVHRFCINDADSLICLDKKGLSLVPMVKEIAIEFDSSIFDKGKAMYDAIT